MKILYFIFIFLLCFNLNLAFAGGAKSLENNPTNWDVYTKEELKRENPFPPEKTLLFALAEVEKFSNGSTTIKTAIDIGSGTGRDTKVLLSKGWTVLAIDSEPLAMKTLIESVENLSKGKLITQLLSFDRMNLSPLGFSDSVELINSSYSLPYSGRNFENIWSQIDKRLHPGGLFSGQFFGPNDDLKISPDVILHSKSQLEDLFKNFEILLFNEKNYLGTRLDGTPKYWHVFDIVARKKK